MKVKISPKPLEGTVEIISSKSHAHRVFIAAALAQEPTEIVMRGYAKDMEDTISCLRSLGAGIERKSETVWQVKPIGHGGTGNGTATYEDNSLSGTPVLNCGESGSTLRFLIPVAAALGKGAVFTGEGRLPERPIGPLLQELTKHGCVFTAYGVPTDDGASTGGASANGLLVGEASADGAPATRLPFTVGGVFKGGRFLLPGNVSSQFVTGLLFALPLLKEDSQIIITSPMESKAYVDMTISTLRQFGVSIEETETAYEIKGGQHYHLSGAKTIHIEGDWSNAAFWLVAGAVGKTVTCKGISPHSLQADKAITDILRDFGAAVHSTEKTVTVGSPAESLIVLNACSIDASQVPDLVPVLTVAAAIAQGTTEIYNAGRLRMKESDRLSAMDQCLTPFGVAVTQLEEGLQITGNPGGSHRHGIPMVVSGHNDHRIVMSMAIAAIALRTEIIIEGAEAVNKSYPTFFEEWRKLGGVADVL